MGSRSGMRTGRASMKGLWIAVATLALGLMGITGAALANGSDATPDDFNIGSATSEAVQFTNTPNVVLYNATVSDPDTPDSMTFSNDGTFDDVSGDEATRTFASSQAWALSTGDGVKTVYAKYMTGVTESAVVTDDVVLDTVPPSCSIVINAGKGGTKSSRVKLTLESTDDTSGVARMNLSKDGKWGGWRPHETTVKGWGIPKKQGTVIVSVKFKDNAGNKSEKCSDTIVRDTKKPATKTKAQHKAQIQNSVTKIRVKWFATGERKGASKILNYDVQVKALGGGWKNWKTDVKMKHADYMKGEAGLTYSFRSRATDVSGNTGAWSKPAHTHVGG